MVGLVVISHSAKVAEGTVDLMKMMATDIHAAAAGGSDENELGTSFDKIVSAIETVNDGDGVLLLCDMGSSVMTADMIIETMGYKDVKVADCPLIEGSIVAAMAAVSGTALNDIQVSWENSVLHKN